MDETDQHSGEAGDTAAQAIGPDPAVGAEVCPYCGEQHTAQYTCGQWARLHGAATRAGSAAGSPSALPPLPVLSKRPPFVVKAHVPPAKAWVWTPIALRIVVICLSIVGAFVLVRGAVDHFDASSSSAAAIATLPPCTPQRVLQNAQRAAAINAQTGAVLFRRIDATNALVLSSSNDCTDQLLMAFTAYIQYEGLCLELPSSGACQQATAARAQLAQVINGQ
ncbi:MAG: hypothetical protein ACYDCQ_08925 [Dehalococcoidia bacterium]